MDAEWAFFFFATGFRGRRSRSYLTQTPPPGSGSRLDPDAHRIPALLARSGQRNPAKGIKINVYIKKYKFTPYQGDMWHTYYGVNLNGRLCLYSICLKIHQKRE